MLLITGLTSLVGSTGLLNDHRASNHSISVQCRAGGLSFPALVTYCMFPVELAVQVSRAVLLTSLRNFGWRTSGLSISALVANDSMSASTVAYLVAV